jgi:hypothetical protein
MKKRAAKAKPAAKSRAAARAGARTKKPAARAKKPAARTAETTSTKVTPYTPAPLRGDGWPPFRYPLQ